MLDPYRRLSRLQLAKASILVPHPTTVFAGFRRAVMRPDLFIGAVAKAGILSKFMPIFVSDIPFRVTLT